MKKIIGIVSVFIIAIMCITIILNPSQSMAQQLDNNIKDMMNNITSGANQDLATQLSSNPYDYTKNNKYFDEIVAMGVDVLPLIEDYINTSSSDGLTEYMLAIAVEKIAKINLKTDGTNNYKWETAKGFTVELDKHIKKVSSSVDDIFSSNLNEKEKSLALEKQGIFAVPYVIEKLKNSTKEQPEIIGVVQQLVSDSTVSSFSQKDLESFKKWSNTNEEKFIKLKKYIDDKALK